MAGNKTLKKITKRANDLNPMTRKKPTWKRMLPVGGTAAAGVAGSFVLNKAARAVAAKGKQAKRSTEKLGDLKEKVTSAADAASEAKTPIGAFSAAAKKMSGSNGQSATANTKLRHIIKEEIDVGVPRSIAYNQWTQFEEFSKIFKGVQSTDQEADEELKWSAKIGPSDRQWTAEITEQVPDERIVWKSTGGTNVEGVVTFHSLDENLTRVMVEMEYHPQGVIEKTGNLLRIQRRRVRRDLRLFKHFLELRGEETGAWRGEISENGEPSGSDRHEESRESQADRHEESQEPQAERHEESQEPQAERQEESKESREDRHEESKEPQESQSQS